MISHVSRAVSRRGFLRGSSVVAVAALVTAPRVLAQSTPTSAGPPDPRVVEDLVAANRVLADQGVVDGYGHVSVRHPGDPSRYLMA